MGNSEPKITSTERVLINVSTDTEIRFNSGIYAIFNLKYTNKFNNLIPEELMSNGIKRKELYIYEGKSGKDERGIQLSYYIQLQVLLNNDCIIKSKQYYRNLDEMKEIISNLISSGMQAHYKTEYSGQTFDQIKSITSKSTSSSSNEQMY